MRENRILSRYTNLDGVYSTYYTVYHMRYVNIDSELMLEEELMMK